MTPRENFPRMKLKHPKSMHISELSSKCTCSIENKAGPSNCKQNKSKLFAETSLYSAPAKLLRPVKSELKSFKECLKLKPHVDYMNSLPETEVRTVSMHSLNTTAINLDSSESDDEHAWSKQKKKSVSLLKNKQPKRILDYSDKLLTDGVAKSIFSLEHFWKKFKKCSTIQNNVFKKSLLSFSKKKFTKANYLVSIKSHPLATNETNLPNTNCRMSFIRKEKENILYDSKRDKIYASSSESSNNLENSSMSGKIILNDTAANTNISINQYDSEVSSILTSVSDSESTLQNYNTSTTSDFSDNLSDNVPENAIRRACLSEQLIENNKIHATDIPILIPVKDSSISLEDNTATVKKSDKLKISLISKAKNKGLVQTGNNLFHEIKNDIVKSCMNDSLNSGVVTKQATVCDLPMQLLQQNLFPDDDKQSKVSFDTPLNVPTVSKTDASTVKLDPNAKESKTVAPVVLEQNKFTSVIAENCNDTSNNNLDKNKSLPVRIQNKFTGAITENCNDTRSNILDKNTIEVSKLSNFEFNTFDNNPVKLSDCVKSNISSGTVENIQNSYLKSENVVENNETINICSEANNFINVLDIFKNQPCTTRVIPDRLEKDSTDIHISEKQSNVQCTPEFKDNVTISADKINPLQPKSQEKSNTNSKQHEAFVVTNKFQVLNDPVTKTNNKINNIPSQLSKIHIKSKSAGYKSNRPCAYTEYSKTQSSKERSKFIGKGKGTNVDLSKSKKLTEEIKKPVVCNPTEKNIISQKSNEISGQMYVNSEPTGKHNNSILNCSDGTINKINKPCLRKNKTLPVRVEKVNNVNLNSKDQNEMESQPCSSKDDKYEMPTRDILRSTEGNKKLDVESDKSCKNIAEKKSSENTLNKLKIDLVIPENLPQPRHVVKETSKEMISFFEEHLNDKIEIICDLVAYQKQNLNNCKAQQEKAIISKPVCEGIPINTKQDEIFFQKSLTKLKDDIKNTTREILDRIKDPNIRDLCDKLITAISKCEEGKCIKEEIDSLVVTFKSSHKALLEKSLSLKSLTGSMLANQLLSTIDPEVILNNCDQVIKEITKKDCTLILPSRKDKIDAEVTVNISAEMVPNTIPYKSLKKLEFGCQANTLSRKILNSSPDELHKKFIWKNSKKICGNKNILIKPICKKSSLITNSNPGDNYLKQNHSSGEINNQSIAQLVTEPETALEGSKTRTELEVTNKLSKRPNKDDLVIITAYANELSSRTSSNERAYCKKKKLKTWTTS